MSMTESRFRRLLAKEKRTLAETNELLDQMVGHIATQGAAIIDLRAKMVDHKDAIEGIGERVMPGFVAPQHDNPARPELIGFEPPPKLKVN